MVGSGKPRPCDKKAPAMQRLVGSLSGEKVELGVEPILGRERAPRGHRGQISKAGGPGTQRTEGEAR